MPSVATHPIQVLREHATALEAAFSVCLADPEKRAVHKLRTETRRIEALLAFLRLLRGLPPFRAAAGKLLKQTRKLRQAAGKVRDFDVQHKLIKDEADKTLQNTDDPATLRTRFDEMLGSLDEGREQAAHKLLKVMRKRQARVTRSLERLLEALEPAKSRSVSPTEMITLVNGAFRATHELRLKEPTEDDLHTIRKAAKQARYQLETAPNAATVRKAAQQFEALQDAGGEWHDWLELTGLAERGLGEHHRITLAFAAERDRHLRSYKRLLEEARARVAARPRKRLTDAPDRRTPA